MGAGSYSEVKARAVAIGVAAGLLSAMGFLTLSQGKAEARAVTMMPVNSAEVASLAKMASSNPEAARRGMVRLYIQNGLNSGPDYTVAATVLGDSPKAEDVRLAHDLAVAGLALGDRAAAPIAAKTEDRIYKSLGLGERYGTLGAKKVPLTDRHRAVLGVLGGNRALPNVSTPVPAATLATAS